MKLLYCFFIIYLIALAVPPGDIADGVTAASQ